MRPMRYIRNTGRLVTLLPSTGMSAGSYRDLTRVAWLNPEMWTQLFFDNKDNLMREIDTLMQNMQAYRDALAADDRETMKRLLDEGRRRKEEVDG